MVESCLKTWKFDLHIHHTQHMKPSHHYSPHCPLHTSTYNTVEPLNVDTLKCKNLCIKKTTTIFLKLTLEHKSLTTIMTTTTAYTPLKINVNTSIIRTCSFTDAHNYITYNRVEPL